MMDVKCFVLSFLLQEYITSIILEEEKRRSPFAISHVQLSAIAFVKLMRIEHLRISLAA